MPSEEEKQIIGRIEDREIVDEMRESYLDYAMSVIVSRALPDVRDGLKPVHRRILYAMYGMGLGYGAKFRKSAAITGEVLGKYHPHGDAPVYETLVRMAQDFSLRYPLVSGQGNFGCFTQDTKVRLADGRSLTFGELIAEQKQGKRHWTFSFNHQINEIAVAEIKNPRLTRRQEKIIEITLDNKEKIKCTLDHRFMLRDGNYKEAQDLKTGDSLMPFYAKLYEGKEDRNLKGYEMIYQPINNKWEFVHRLSDKWNLDRGVYERKDGRIRHHIDFNKLNNNPDNIVRIQWQDHWKYHKDIAFLRHKTDPEYIKKISDGRNRFWANKKNKKLRSELQSERNKIMWRVAKYRNRWIDSRKQMWKDPQYREYMRKASSRNIKHLWQRQDFQNLMSRLKSKEMKERWKNEDYRTRMTEQTRQWSRRIWSKPSHRKYISDLMKERFRDFELRTRQGEIARALWKNPEYRAKYAPNHFSNMAKAAWKNPGFREAQRKKAIQQWQDPEFGKNFISGVKRANRRRLMKNPDFMKEIAHKAKISLTRKWKDDKYKDKVIKSKILGYVWSLLTKHGVVTPELYEKERTNNCIPRIENALNYFNDFPEIVSLSQRRNHKVVGTKILRKLEDVYDLTIEPWHNFLLDAGVFVHNSIDSDPPAAQRYTEAKLSKIGEEMLKDIEKETVNFMDNYDSTRQEPGVLPSPLPQLLLNGSVGIAVGMATNIPPHNLSELADALIYLVDNPKADTDDISQFVKGPDFPTGGAVYGKKDIIDAYTHGKGPVVTRGRAEVEEQEKTGRSRIIITEIPFQVQKSGLVEQIANLVQEKRIEGVKDLRDESDREGMRIVVELQKEAYPQKILNRLYKFTDLQKTFHFNMLALVDGIQPRVLSLAELLNYFLLHRTDVVQKRTKYDLARAKERAHILEGLHKCLANIDEVIKIIKNSKNREEAHANLIKRFKLTSIQANAILETKLAALARLERQKIEDELKQLKTLIKELSEILKSPARIKGIIKKELKETKEKFGDERKTRVFGQKVGEIAEEDLIPQEETIITLTQGGYVKRINPSTYKIQKRGGKGILGMKTLQEDIVEHFLLSQTHDSLLFFTDSGKVFRTPAYEIPEGSRVARGRGLSNFLEVSSEEKVLSLMSFGKEDEALGIKNLIMITLNGIIKKTALEEFGNVRKSGLIAIKLRKDDLLKKVEKSAGQDDIIIVTRKGQSIRFKEKQIREMGRPASGVRGIHLRKGDQVVGMNVIQNPKSEKRNPKNGTDKPSKQYLLVVTENGYGKRTDLAEYREQGRGGTGIKTANITPKTGNLVSAAVLTGEEEDLIVISQKGNVIRTEINSIPKLSRATQGVKIMRLDEEDKVASTMCI